MSFVRGRQADFARDRFRSFAWSGVNPQNLSPPVALFGGAAVVGPRIIFALGLGFQSFVWAGVNPAPEKPELYRAVLTQQQRPLDIQRSFFWPGVQPANVSATVSNPPRDMFVRGRQAEFAYGEAGKSFVRAGNQPTAVAPQVPLFGTALFTRPTDLQSHSPSFTWSGAFTAAPAQITGTIAGVFYWQDEGERHYNNRSFAWRGVPYEERIVLDEVTKAVMLRDRVADLTPGFQSFVRSGVAPTPVFPEVYRSILTAQQLPLDIQRGFVWPGQVPADFVPEIPQQSRMLFTQQQAPLAGVNLPFTFDRPPPDEILPPIPLPTHGDPPGLGRGRDRTAIVDQVIEFDLPTAAAKWTLRMPLVSVDIIADPADVLLPAPAPIEPPAPPPPPQIQRVPDPRTPALLAKLFGNMTEADRKQLIAWLTRRK